MSARRCLHGPARALIALVAVVLAAVASAAPPGSAPAGSGNGDDGNGPRWVHAYAQFGEPKYPRGFPYFEYVNPDAPKGGTLYLSNPDRRTSFDKYNPFTLRGNAPGGLVLFMFESLAVISGDELQTMYGLLAEEMLIAPDKSSITFRLNPKARFHDGDPVTAADVKFSYERVISKEAAPQMRSVLAGVAAAEVIDQRTIRFDLKERSAELLFTLGAGLPVFSRKWGAGPDGKPKPFDQVVTEYPITTGPYTIGLADSGRRIEFVRNPQYWARDLGVRRGQFNFDRVVYRYYKDRAVSIEAFKAGEFDILLEYSARRWARQHDGPKWRDGRIVKREFVDQRGAGLQAYYMNLRRPLFQDVRVRSALDLAYDFEAVNSFGQYKRTYSVFSNSEFAAEGLPSAGERSLLEPFRDRLLPEVFGPAWRPPRQDSPQALRRNLLRARALLEQAGWKVAADGVLRNAAGQAFEFEYLTPEEGAARTVATWQRNLEKLGITMKLRRADFALYRRRLEVFDFDMVGIRSASFQLPDGTGLKDGYGSANADIEGSSNIAGIRNPALDAIITAITDARTLDELRDACRAFDRIFMHENYVVPELYGATYRVSYWNRLGIPKVVPKFYTIESPNDTVPPWAATAWWSLDAERQGAGGTRSASTSRQ